MNGTFLYIYKILTIVSTVLKSVQVDVLEYIWHLTVISIHSFHVLVGKQATNINFKMGNGTHSHIYRPGLSYHRNSDV